MKRSDSPKGEKNTSTVFNIQYVGSGDNEIELVECKDSEEDIASTSDVYVIKEIESVKQILEHVCGICDRSYRSFQTLKKHMKKCKGTNKPKNDKLIDESYDELSLEEIIALQKDANKLLENNYCYCCDENLETAHAGHIRCQDCPKSFKTVNSYRRHASFLHSSLPNAKLCNVCNARCPTELILDLHLWAHKIGKSFACHTCGKEFTRKYHLQRHEMYSSCDPTKQQPANICKVCGKEFFRIDNLRTHLRQHIGEDKKIRDYHCPYCQKTFGGTTTLNIHIRTHTGEKPFICDVCKRGFPSNGALRKHRRSHTGEKPFKCNVCERAFGAKEVLNRHMKTHTGDRPHICNMCGKSFIQATQLKAHMFHHTGDGIPCEKCGAEFNRKGRVAEHMEDFHTDKPKVFDCKPCHFNCDSKNDLQDHMKTHENLRMYKCRACEIKFIHRRNHVHCDSCKICSQNIGEEDLVHDHVPLKPQSKPQAKSQIIISEDIDSDSSHDGKPRKLKILTSKSKKKPATTRTTVKKILKCNEDPQPCSSNDIEEIYDDFEMSEKTEDEFVVDTIDAKVEPAEAGPMQQVQSSRVIMNDETLNDCVAKLLNLLLDFELLSGFGWPDASIEHVLSSVISKCGHEPADYDTCLDYSTKIRENVKLLFTVVIDNDSFRNLLNNHTIDEVILQILQMTSN